MKKSQKRFLEFISEPLTKQSTARFSRYIIKHNKLKQICSELSQAPNLTALTDKEKLTYIELLLINGYNMFWECPIEERAVVIDHVLIPPKAMLDDNEINRCYNHGFDYITGKILPHKHVKNSDDEFACSYLVAYLV